MTIRKACPTVFTSLDDGTAVLLNLTTFVYYSLNRTGAAVWQEIEQKKSVELTDLVQLVHQRFDVDEAAASTHLTAFLEKLTEFGVVETAA
jgi:hypothetical protein